MTLTAARSQKSDVCPISFVLDDKSGGGGAVIEKKMFIRPEELTRTAQSRMAVTQTFGGAWFDSFGEGLETTTLSGTLGWRTDEEGRDGLARLIDMRDEIYVGWHAKRDSAIKRGDNPSLVNLVYVDVLNNYIRNIAMQVFEIRRSKSRPLLASYRISFTASSTPSNVYGVKKTEVTIDPSGASVTSFSKSIDTLNSNIVEAKKFVNKSILEPVQSFMSLTTVVMKDVNAEIQAGLSVTAPLIDLARSISQSGTNIFRTMAAISGIPMASKAALMQVSGAYSNMFCVLKNGLKPTGTYENYNNLYGSSNCSSTAGGSPPSIYAGSNPFFNVIPQEYSKVSVSTSAKEALRIFSSNDVVNAPLSISEIGNALSVVVSGVSVS